MKSLPFQCSYFPFSDEPLIKGLPYASRFSKPFVLLPETGCDGRWHLFCQSGIGLHHFVSDSGIEWEPKKVIEFGAGCPFIYKEGDSYYLLYVKYSNDFSFLKAKDKYSIEVRSSTDLVIWSRPRVLLDSTNLSFNSVSNPQLFKVKNGYRLYLGVCLHSLQYDKSMVPEKYVYFESSDFQGPYFYDENTKPLFEALPDDRWMNLAAGNARIFKFEECFYAFLCGIYWDSRQERSHSAITVFSSDDGLSFAKCLQKPVLEVSESGWASDYILSCDVQYRTIENCWYCYFSATGQPVKRKKYESIGLLLGSKIINSNSVNK